jgi:tetratricopeptide (TPR) repeat protein/predicted O-methyltransferase YrrM
MPVRHFLNRILTKAQTRFLSHWPSLPKHESFAPAHKAQVLVDRGEWQAAIEECHKILQSNPNDAWTYKALAEAQSGKGEFQLAIDNIQKAIELAPDQGYLYYSLGRIHLNQNQLNESIVANRRAVELDEGVSWFHYQLGESLVKNKQWQEAIGSLQQSIELNSSFPWTPFYLAEAFLGLEQIEAAIDCYRHAIKADPNNPDLDYIQSSLAYAEHLQNQDQRIQSFVQSSQEEDQQETDRPLRILLVAPYPTYPPKLGGITRMFHEMKTLGNRFTLAVACFVFAKEDYKLETDLANYCQLPLTVTIGNDTPPQPGEPQLIHRYSSSRMRKVLEKLNAANFDIVVFDMIYMAQYRDLFPQAFHVLSEQNIESQLLRSCSQVTDAKQVSQMAQQQSSVQAFVESETEANLLSYYERNQWPNFPLRWVVSDIDKADLDRRCSLGKTMVVSNGVDTKAIQSFEDNPNNRILFIGTLSYFPNIDGAGYFVEKILPHIWKQDPTVEFWIAGASPPQDIVDLGNHPQITVIANPEDMTEIARQCCITVVPLRIGSGTRIKILQAFGMGLPIVTTTLGCEGLAVNAETHLLIEDEAEAFATATLRLLSDRNLRQIFRKNGRTLVELQYDWDQIYQAAATQLEAEFRAWLPTRPITADSALSPIDDVIQLDDVMKQSNSSQDLILNWALNQVQEPLYYPQAYVDLIEDCLRPTTIHLKTLRRNSKPELPASRRFATLIEALKNPPAIDFPLAKLVALTADRYRYDRTVVESASWLGDVGTHFEMSSSFGNKGRILNTIVRYGQCKRGIELGTAYGMSGLFILDAMKFNGEDYHLATLEGQDPQFTLASKLLKSLYGDDRVSCYFGWTEEKVPEMVKNLSNMDFMFHDAGHSKKHYVNDFNAIVPILAPGAIVIIDDITWDDRRFCDEDPKTYEGWLEVANHPRVIEAVEVDYGLGLLLLE